jgi:hypothetical protein
VASPEHDAVVVHVARTRFPFAGQTTWPADYQTITNVPEPRRGIEGPAGIYYPDIVILDGTGRSREIGEVELRPDPDRVAEWRAGSRRGSRYAHRCEAPLLLRAGRDGAGDG